MGRDIHLYIEKRILEPTGHHAEGGIWVCALMNGGRAVSPYRERNEDLFAVLSGNTSSRGI